MDLLRELLFEFGWVIPAFLGGSIIWSILKGRKRAQEMREAGALLNLRAATKPDKKALEDRIKQSRLFSDERLSDLMINKYIICIVGNIYI